MQETLITSLKSLQILFGTMLLRYRDMKHARLLRSLGLNRFREVFEGQTFVYFAAYRYPTSPTSLQLKEKDRRPLLILLHGFLDRGFVFRRIAEDLNRDFRLIIVDLPGHGGSSLPALRELWTVASMSRSLFRFISSICDEPPTLLTHSMGGLVVLQMFLYAKTRQISNPFRSLCALAPGALLLQPHELKALRQRFFPETPEEVQQLLHELHGKDERRRELPPFLLRGLLHRWSEPGFHYLAMNTMEYPEEVFLVAEQLKRCDLPVTLIWGDSDRIVSVKQGRKIAALLPRAELHLIENAGHALLAERPADVLRLFRASLKHAFHSSKDSFSRNQRRNRLTK